MLLAIRLAVSLEQAKRSPLEKGKTSKFLFKIVIPRSGFCDEGYHMGNEQDLGTDNKALSAFEIHRRPGGTPQDDIIVVN